MVFRLRLTSRTAGEAEFEACGLAGEGLEGPLGAGVGDGVVGEVEDLEDLVALGEVDAVVGDEGVERLDLVDVRREDVAGLGLWLLARRDGLVEVNEALGGLEVVGLGRLVVEGPADERRGSRGERPVAASLSRGSAS